MRKNMLRSLLLFACLLFSGASGLETADAHTVRIRPAIAHGHWVCSDNGDGYIICEYIYH